jgi:hypothetical protein
MPRTDPVRRQHPAPTTSTFATGAKDQSEQTSGVLRDPIASGPTESTLSPPDSSPQTPASIPAQHSPKPNASPELTARFASGVEAAIACLPMGSALRSTVLRRTSTSTISEIDHDALTGAISQDVIAGVLAPFDGPFRGTALLAVDPGDALLWLSVGDDEGEPLVRFVSLGREMLAAVIGSLAAERSATEVGVGAGILEERPLLAALLATHAPSDTVILSLDAEISFELDASIGPLHTPFTVQLLLEPKLLDSLLAETPAD